MDVIEFMLINYSIEVEHLTQTVNSGLVDATLSKKLKFVDIPESKLYLIVILYVSALKPFGTIIKLFDVGLTVT